MVRLDELSNLNDSVILLSVPYVRRSSTKYTVDLSKVQKVTVSCVCSIMFFHWLWSIVLQLMWIQGGSRVSLKETCIGRKSSCLI